MNNLRAAAQQALEALEEHGNPYRGHTSAYQSAIIALRVALVEPEQEPVAYFDPQEKGFYWAKPTVIKTPMTVSIEPLPLYSAPTPRKPLSEKELDDLRQADGGALNFVTLRAFRVVARAVEAAHGITGESK